MHKYDSYNDEDLVGLLKSGNMDAFSAIHRRYYGILYTHAYKRLPEREEIRDMLQEVFAGIWDNRETLNLNINLQAHLYTTVRNRILNLFKRHKIRSEYITSFEVFVSDHTPMADSALHIKELIALIEEEVNALPPQMRLIFNMSRNANLSHKEIAEQLDISPLTVKKQVHNSLKILRLKLGTHFLFLFF